MGNPAEHRPTPVRSRGRMLAGAGIAVVLGVTVIHNSMEESGPPPQPTAAAAGVTPGPSARPTAGPTPVASPSPSKPAGPAMSSSAPVRIVIKKIGVDAPFTGLKLNANGVLNVPPANNQNLAGWYEDGVTPGARGNAIVLGHVDTMSGPAVFWGLGALKPGDHVDVTRADSTVAEFTLDSVDVFPKDDFPDDRVYGDTDDAEIRLITCGGVYDKKAKNYTANVVAFGHLTASKTS